MRDRPGDRYDTAPPAVHALLAVEKLPKLIWEPACGKGNIVKVLNAAGHIVIATDIRKRGCPDSALCDFLNPGDRVNDADCILTNPPYSFATQFISKALDQCPLVIMLLRLNYLEGGTPKTAAGRERAQVLDRLSRVHVFANRLPMMHRAGWKGPRASSAIAFAWYVWDRDHKGPTTIDRIRWE
jgi:hypothetical protein